MLAGIAASACVAISNIPFLAPIGHVRVGRIEGKLILFPTVEQIEYSDFDLVVAGTKNAVNMIEIGGREISEDDVADAIEFGHKAIIEIVGAIEELASKVGHATKVGTVGVNDEDLIKAIREKTVDKIREVKGKPGRTTAAKR